MYGATAKVFPSTMVSNLTLSVAVDLTSVWDKVWLEIPTHACMGTQYILGSDSLTGTYHRLNLVDTADGSPNVIQCLEPNGAKLAIPGGFQFFKIEGTSTTTDTALPYKFHCS